ncbi:MAG: portal protein [Candidatus Fimenecus sp.]
MTYKKNKNTIYGNDKKENTEKLEKNIKNTDDIDNGFKVLSERIGENQINKAIQILKEYKEGKANLEKKIIDNEQWYKMRHWECMRDKKQAIQPTSAWLFNCIANKHADAMDNFPSPNILPREEGDKQQAQALTSIIPVILDQCDFEQVYSDVWNYKLKTGTGVYMCIWDFNKLNGLGDISIKKVDLINLFWESGITDIQDSKNLFYVEVRDNDELIEEYPKLEGKLGEKTLDIAQYIYDDTVKTDEKSIVVDWYYHKRINGKKVLHYCKFVNNSVLFASENDENLYEVGWYAHGLYPFVFDPLYGVEGTPTGFGYIDIGKDAQAFIDRGNQAIMQNMLANSKPRHFIRSDGAVKEEEYADLTKDFVHVDGNLGQDSILPISGKPLNDIYVAIINNKIDELKETTGNRDISTGGTTAGVTAASAIAAMQEAGSKLSRDNSKAAYRAYKKIILMVIELIRQFYDLPRYFRILGENGGQEFVSFDNSGIIPQAQGDIDSITGEPMEAGVDVGYRLPLFDIEITAQKQSPYSKMSQNELALQFYQAGFFNPQLSDQALACIDMMDFDRKQFVMQKISQNNTMYQQMISMQQQMMSLGQMLDERNGSNEITTGLAQQFNMQAPQIINNRIDSQEITKNEKKESSITENARKRVADSTNPT